MEKSDTPTHTVGSLVKARLLTSSSLKAPDSFHVCLTGRVETAEMFGVNDIYCKYSFIYGSDWQITSVSYLIQFNSK